MKRHRPAAMVVVVDFLLAVLLMQQAILSLTTIQRKTPPSIETLGYYAVDVTWKTGIDDDVDTYVQDPNGQVVFFMNPTAGLMNLERDDTGMIGDTQTTASGQIVQVKTNHERVILRGVVPGEYTVNVQLYRKDSTGSDPVKVKLTRLKGQDEVVTQQTVVLSRSGQEETAFRFTLGSDGFVKSINHLQKRFVGQANGQGQSYYIDPSNP